MATFTLGAPLSRILNASGSAGPRRLAAFLAVAVLLIVGVVLALRHHAAVETPSSVAKAPQTDPLPGGPHTNPAYAELARRADQEKAAKAAARGESSVASMPGGAFPEAAPMTPPPLRTTTADQPPPLAKRAPTETPAPTTAADPPAPRKTAPVAQQPKPDENQVKAYQAAISSLFKDWSLKPQVTEVILKPGEHPGGDTQPNHADASNRTMAAVDRGDAVTPIPNAPRLAGSGGQVLMPAGRGVYGHTILAASSDYGGQLLVEAQSGPIAGDRMTGSFERREDRLVAHLDSITLADGTQHKIDAVLVAPDSKETAVASSVQQHLVSRYVLPVASAFVAGLGQAIAQSNSTVVAGPYGGATAFQRLNLGQQLGVAAGSAGAQFGTAVRENAPRGPTVKIDAGAEVGIVFLAPLVVGDNR